MAADQKKDQSYFLWTLNSDQVRQLLFPIGEMSKEKVQDMAKFLGLPVAEARESFDVCFIDDFTTSDPRRDPRDGRGVRPRMTTHLGNYLRQHLPPTYFKAGEVVNLGGKVVGCHFGLPLYTIGQHKGLIISIKSSNRPVFYVIKKDVVSNRLVVGSKEEAQTASFLIKDINGIDFIKSIKGVNAVTGSLCVRMRHQGALVRVKEVKKVGEALEVVLSEPVLGVAPGQSAVFYQGEELVGGGIIS
jgi:tRNA-specific 2-thiouridylase